jgi:hypothetical protein
MREKAGNTGSSRSPSAADILVGLGGETLVKSLKSASDMPSPSAEQMSVLAVVKLSEPQYNLLSERSLQMRDAIRLETGVSMSDTAWTAERMIYEIVQAYFREVGGC